MNIFTVFALTISSFNLIYTLSVNLGVLHYEDTNPLNKAVIERVDRYYKRQGKAPIVDFLQTDISRTDLISANRTLCSLTADGVIGFLGPTFSPILPITESISSNLEVPHIEYTWKPTSTPQKMTLNFYPETHLLAKGFAALVNSMNWKSFTVLYETVMGLTRLKHILKLSVSKELPVVFKQIYPNDDYRPILKQIKNYTENTIIIECALERIPIILTQAKEVNMLEIHNRYFLANLDAHTLNFKDLNTTANITTISLLNTSTAIINNAVKDWNDGYMYKIRPDEVRVEQAILHDAAYFFMRRLYELSRAGDYFERAPLYCNQQNTSPTGYRVYNYLIKKSEMVGESLTAPIKFDEFGRRIDFNLYAVEISNNKKEVFAYWNPSMDNSVHLYRDLNQTTQLAVENLQKVLVKVVSRIGAPYLFEKKNKSSELSPDGVEVYGYSYDLITEIAEILNFTFVFRICNEYGKFDPLTKSWNGLIGELLKRQADMAICDLTITETRRAVVDFSLPFMNLGVSILHSRAKNEQNPDIFAFTDPFNYEVWIYTVTLYLIISSVLYIICRFAPGDWENPHPCDPEPEELENIWDLKNCFWLTLGSIMTQGCDILPKGISSRMGTSMWWFFSLIMTSSYTANLAAFLTKERMGSTISSAEDLSKQTKIKYGTVLNGATMAFFKNSNFSTYQRLWMNMEQSKPNVFAKSNAEGVKRVLNAKNQDYAFFMESSSIEYEIEKDCNLKQIGGRLDSKGYGIAMPMNSPYRSAIDHTILKLQESGKLGVLKRRWWKEEVEKDSSCEGDAGKQEEPSNELVLGNVGGVFIVLSVGVAIAFLLAFIEFLWNVQKVAMEEHITYWEALVVELKFAVKVWITKKRAKPVLSDSSSNVSDTRSIAQRVIQTAGSFINLDVFDKISNTKKQ